MNSYTGTMEERFRQRRADGHKLLVPYITAGFPGPDWARLIEGMAAAGADAIEIGIPFSDPVMDGPTIQESTAASLAMGTTPLSALNDVAETDGAIPLGVMTYYNIAYSMGHTRFAGEVRQAGVCGVILPDLPLEESDRWTETADAHGLETVMLAAPTASDERLERIVQRARGFVYGVGVVGITGERAELASSALDISRRLKAITDTPVLVGIGVSSPQQAAEVSQIADGVVIGSAIIRHMIDGSMEQAIDYVGQLRAGIDRG